MRLVTGLPASALLGWALVVDGLVLFTGPSAVRTLLVAVFLLLGPGLGIVGLFGVEDPWALLTLAFGLSVALDTFVALTLVYVVGWYPGAGLGVLLAISIAGALAQLWVSVAWEVE
ncbi:MAG: hypothetical protein QOD83_518 [Solirubrobacteraceae bacterium]|jgi:uncharacterized membrane protein|nr:hypothetical protein [Solirubrobacteraceae bacterium]MEA2186481.1 hypothetical protein [Solirubrobacteraceae bacterium]MEA2230702.1 hypothetical protein [Solirubrobacteraceae bacterium]